MPKLLIESDSSVKVSVVKGDLGETDTIPFPAAAVREPVSEVVSGEPPREPVALGDGKLLEKLTDSFGGIIEKFGPIIVQALLNALMSRFGIK